jgi:23S rRNA pseudouridine2605 synthase
MNAPERVDAAAEAAVQRLQKVLASAGLGSRRGCEELIAAGRVTVDGRVATLGAKVDPRSAVVHVDGSRVVIDDRQVYLAVNKPPGVLSAMSDDRGRRTVADLVDDLPQRVFHVGRLDADSEGLLLLTNDGDLAHRLAHPSYGVPKTYLCEVSGPVPRSVERALLAGIDLDDGPARADRFRVVDTVPPRALVELVIHEGRNRIVRRMLETVGHPVRRLVRTGIGPIRLGDLRPGRHRRLSRTEVSELYRMVGL